MWRPKEGWFTDKRLIFCHTRANTKVDCYEAGADAILEGLEALHTQKMLLNLGADCAAHFHGLDCCLDIILDEEAPDTKAEG